MQTFPESLTGSGSHNARERVHGPGSGVGVSGFDSVACLQVEQMQLRRVEGEANVVPDPDPRFRRQPSHDACPTGLGFVAQMLQRTVVDVGHDLSHFVGDDGDSVGFQVGDDLGAEVLDVQDPCTQTFVASYPHVFRPHTHRNARFLGADRAQAWSIERNVPES